jgi:hypothetical protein
MTTKPAPWVNLAQSDPVEAVEYVLQLLDVFASASTERFPGSAPAIRDGIASVREVMKLPKRAP